MARQRRNRILVVANALLSILMLGSAAYAAVSSTADVNNEVSTGAVNISLDHLLDDGSGEAVKVYENEDITTGAVISSVPRITNKGIASYIRLSVHYYDAAGDVAERAPENDLGTDWVEIGDYYYLTRQATSGEVFDVFKSITAPSSWDHDGNTQVVMVLQADAIQAAHFNPDFSSETPWGAVAIEDFADSDYQVDTESHSSAVTISYDGVAGQYISVPENFLAQLNLLAPGDSVESEITVNNTDSKEHEFWTSVDIADSRLGDALVLKIVKGGEVLYEGPLSEMPNLSLGKYAPGASEKISVTLSLPVETGNNAGGIGGTINWKFRVDAAEEAEPIPVGPKTGDDIMISITICLLSFAGLIIVYLFEKRDQKEEE